MNEMDRTRKAITVKRVREQLKQIDALWEDIKKSWGVGTRFQLKYASMASDCDEAVNESVIRRLLNGELPVTPKTVWKIAEALAKNSGGN